MTRIATILAAVALAFGAPALAQQASEATSADETEAGQEVGAPMEQETGVKGVYSLKSMMGLSADSADEEDAADETETGAGPGGDEDDEAEEGSATN